MCSHGEFAVKVAGKQVSRDGFGCALIHFCPPEAALFGFDLGEGLDGVSVGPQRRAPLSTQWIVATIEREPVGSIYRAGHTPRVLGEDPPDLVRSWEDGDSTVRHHRENISGCRRNQWGSARQHCRIGRRPVQGALDRARQIWQRSASGQRPIKRFSGFGLSEEGRGRVPRTCGFWSATATRSRDGRSGSRRDHDHRRGGAIEREVDHEVFPLRRIFDTAALFEWQNSYVSARPDIANERQDRWIRFFDSAVKPFLDYVVPVIVLGKSTPKEAVCTVFEKVNTGGVPLNVSELLTATFAIDGFRLKDDWETRSSGLKKLPVLAAIENTDFLQTVTLLATRARKMAFGGDPDDSPAISCRRRDILRLTLNEYQTWADRATDGLAWAASFLAHEHILNARDLPYKSQLVPLAAIRAIVGPSIDDYGTNAQVRQWYWCGVLGELYGAATESRFARDVEQAPGWIAGGDTPKTIDDSIFHAGRLLTLRTRNSATYKGIYALLMREGALDWQKHQKLEMATFFDYRIDIHHIFRKAWCAKEGVPAERRESIVNKTAISAATNRSIGGRAPSEYLATLERNAGISSGGLDAIIGTHAIDPAYLRTDEFNSFFADRAERLLAIISEATGKEAIREDLLREGDPDAFEPIVEDPEQFDEAFDPLSHEVGPTAP